MGVSTRDRIVRASSRLALGLLVGLTTMRMSDCLSQNSGGVTPSAIPKTWSDEALASLEMPLAEASASPVHVSSDYYYRIPVRPIYKSYPVITPIKSLPDIWSG